MLNCCGSTEIYAHKLEFKVSVKGLYFERLDHFSYKHEVSNELLSKYAFKPALFGCSDGMKHEKRRKILRFTKKETLSRNHPAIGLADDMGTKFISGNNRTGMLPT